MRQSKKKVGHWKKGKLGEKQTELKKYMGKDKKKYSQNWIAYNLAQTNEFTAFQDILIELIDKSIDVRKPLWKNGRPYADFKDMVFCCVMRAYFDKSSRRTTSFLSLAKGKGYIKKTPHFNSILNYYKTERMTAVLKHLIEQSSIPLKEIEQDFTVDASGWSTHLYGRWFDARIGRKSKRRLYKKAHVCSGVKTNIITSVDVSGGYHNDSPFFEGLVKATAKNFDMRQVSADAGYSSRKNHTVVSELGAIPFIMFRSNSRGFSRGSDSWRRMNYFFKKHREEYLKRYHQRSNAESVFNMIKRKMGTHLNGRLEVAQHNELLCKCLSHNICVLISEVYELGISLDFMASKVIVRR